MTGRRFGPLGFVFKGMVGLVVVGALAFGLGALVMVLWNWVMPDLLGVNEITYWQSWGLVLLTHILFKFSPGGRRHGFGRGKEGDRERWKEHMRQWKDRQGDGDDGGTDAAGSEAPEPGTSPGSQKA